jgi:hypothetical protein
LVDDPRKTVLTALHPSPLSKANNLFPEHEKEECRDYEVSYGEKQIEQRLAGFLDFAKATQPSCARATLVYGHDAGHSRQWRENGETDNSGDALLHLLPNVKDEPRDERRSQTENGGAIALALAAGSAWEGAVSSAMRPLFCSEPKSRRRERDGCFARRQTQNHEVRASDLPSIPSLPNRPFLSSAAPAR